MWDASLLGRGGGDFVVTSRFSQRSTASTVFRVRPAGGFGHVGHLDARTPDSLCSLSCGQGLALFHSEFEEDVRPAPPGSPLSVHWTWGCSRESQPKMVFRSSSLNSLAITRLAGFGQVALGIIAGQVEFDVDPTFGVQVQPLDNEAQGSTSIDGLTHVGQELAIL